ncbi:MULTISPECIES: hypothetical protein [Rhizobium]|uniref:Uncharacterized protein n=2 Tax=Rhizobium TaxID=379 RepID=A0AAE8U2A8_9HYPH|nr:MULTISPECIES: hypothetical protein [Rhizobium]ANP85609.1 hypothetical protein BA011_07590 [Rhizobium leguminosarum]NEJ26872.1 hypothetical protein [Rhizobium ruizarguesonis]TBD09917.1 hypothetical protein ELH23_33505 [Rhizobium ruizarguesonis]TBF18997.1 hypothetical protein ELG94_12075 [Rhizobium ruizarguesonis]
MTDTLYNELLGKHSGDLTALGTRQRVEVDEYACDLATFFYASGTWTFPESTDEVLSDSSNLS